MHAPYRRGPESVALAWRRDEGRASLPFMFARLSGRLSATHIDVRTTIPVLVAVAASWVLLGLVPMSHDVAGFAAAWGVMALAMMVPTVMRPLQRVAHGNTGRAFEFVVGYLAIWMVTALPAWFLMIAIPPSPVMVAVLWILVGLYAQMPFVLRSFHACKGLPTMGSAAALGLRQGAMCVTGCAPMMAVAMFSLMSFGAGAVLSTAVMFALMLLMMWQKDPRTSNSALRSVGVALIVGSAVLAVSGGFTAFGAGFHVHQ